MKLKMILESAKHDAALDLISNLVKKSPWKNKVFLAGGAVIFPIFLYLLI